MASSAGENMRGAGLMTLSMAAFTLNDACLKVVSTEMPLSQILFLRGALTTLLLALWVWRTGGFAVPLAKRDRRLIAWRSFAEIAAAYFFLTALFNLPLANATSILQTLPLTVAVAAALFLNEPLGWRRISAIVVGLGGVLLIIRPGTDGFTIYSGYALVAVLWVTVRDLTTRQLSRSVPSMAVAVYGALAVTLGAAGLGLTETWVRPDPMSLLVLLGAVGFIMAAYVLSVAVMRIGDLGFVAPYRYTAILWALVLGLMLFGEWPDPLTLTGAAIVVATGVFTLIRQRQLARAGG